MRRKLFDGVQITERANALLSLPTSALTPRAIGRRNSMIIDRQKMISTGFRPGGNKQLLDLPDDDIQEGEEGEGEYVPPPLPTSESPLGVQHLGLSSHYQLPGHSPSVHSFRKKLGAKSECMTITHTLPLWQGFIQVGERGEIPPYLKFPPYLFHANDTDQSYNLIITILHLKCVLSL